MAVDTYEKEMIEQEIDCCRRKRDRGVSIWDLNKKIKSYCKNCMPQLKELCHQKK